MRELARARARTGQPMPQGRASSRHTTHVACESSCCSTSFWERECVCVGVAGGSGTPPSHAVCTKYKLFGGQIASKQREAHE